MILNIYTLNTDQFSSDELSSFSASSTNVSQWFTCEGGEEQ